MLVGSGAAGGSKHIGHEQVSDFVAPEDQSLLTGKPSLPLHFSPATLGIRQTVIAILAAPIAVLLEQLEAHEFGSFST
jgi:hypothetical protein